MIKKISVILAILIFLAILFSILLFLFSKPLGRREAQYKHLAEDLEKIVQGYIAISNDQELKFNNLKTVSVDELLVRLQKPLIIDGETIGPLLPPRKNPPDAKSYYPLYSSKYGGWKIVINKESKKVSVEPYATNQINIQ